MRLVSGFVCKTDYACHKCGQENAAQTKHLLMFCRCTEEFREHLWRKLIIRFGLGFFNLYIALPTDEQLALLFSGCHALLSNIDDIRDCLKLFVISLCKLNQNLVLAL